MNKKLRGKKACKFEYGTQHTMTDEEEDIKLTRPYL
jgi:hypothetical protein